MFTKTSLFVVGLLTLFLVSGAWANGSITGKVTNANNANPIVGAYVSIYDVNGGFVEDAGPTDSNGDYTSSSLANGTYYAVTKNTQAFVEKIYNNTTCALQGCMITTDGAPITINNANFTANFALAPGGTISGFYTEEATGNPLLGRHVHIHTHEAGMVGISGLSDANGAWSTESGLPAGDYVPVAHTFDEYITEFYDNHLCANYVCNHMVGDAVTVAVGADTPNINFAVQKMDFEDRFGDNALPSPTDWTFKGTWIENSGLLSASATTKATAFANPIFSGCTTDYTVETFMASLGNTVFGTKNKLYFYGWYIDNRNYIQVIMDEESDKWIIKQKVNGTVTGKKKFLAVINPLQFYHIRLHHDGTTIHVYLDGLEIVNFPAGAGMQLNGTVGYFVKATTGYFDNIGAYPEIMTMP